MIVTVGWLGLAAVGVVWEIVCRTTHDRWPSLGTVGSVVGRRLPGRMALLVLWAFVGVHLFARYTLPH